MRDPDSQLSSILLDKVIDFDPHLELVNTPQQQAYIHLGCTVEEYDTYHQAYWLMPQEYKDLDIARWVLERCSTDAELQRVGEELLLYQEYEMFDMLRYMVYLVDTMRQHDIVWGVGRGSSVASYVLYLIGVHRINSMMYDLDIREFLK